MRYFCFVLLNFYFVSFSWAQELPKNINTAVLGKRQMVMMQGGVDQVVGNIIFGIDNNNAVPARLQLPLPMPKNVHDFEPQEGLTKQDIKLGSDGFIYTEKLFEPGSHMIVIAFMAKGQNGAVNLDFEMKTDLDDFAVIVPQNSIRTKIVAANSQEISPSGDLSPMDFGGKIFERQEFKNIKAETKLTVKIDRLSEGRKLYWIVAISSVVLLSLASIAMVLRTRHGS